MELEFASQFQGTRTAERTGPPLASEDRMIHNGGVEGPGPGCKSSECKDNGSGERLNLGLGPKRVNIEDLCGLHTERGGDRLDGSPSGWL